MNRTLSRPCLVAVCAAFLLGGVFMAGPAIPDAAAQQARTQKPPAKKEQMVTMDFNQVDLPTFIKFVSELTKLNFAIDDRVKGKVTIYAPSKIPVSDVYNVFEQVLELKGFGLVPSDNVVQVLPLSDMPPVRDIHVYYLQNASAEEMAKVLTGVVSRSSQAGTARRPQPRGRSVPGARGQEFEGVVQILADAPTNALIITASPRDFNMIKEVLAKLDVKRRQVYVEAVILEVTQDADSSVGVEGFGVDLPELSKFTGFGGTSTLGGGKVFSAPGSGIGSSLDEAFNSISGLTLGAVKQFTLNGTDFFSVGALVQAVASDANINVLSTPQILTSDNQKAEIVVGDNIPILTSQSQTTGATPLSQIERKDVGITLRLTPQILESDLVKLDVFQEISGVRRDVPTGFDVNVQGVITSKKSATTTVIVQDDQTVVIGGLVSDNVTESVKKVPILGDIPLLGWLFKSRTKETTKTNLLIFLTPHVIHDPDELFALQQGKSREMLGFIQKQKIPRKTKKQRIRFLEQAINPPNLSEVEPG